MMKTNLLLAFAMIFTLYGNAQMGIVRAIKDKSENTKSGKGTDKDYFWQCVNDISGKSDSRDFDWYNVIKDSSNIVRNTYEERKTAYLAKGKKNAEVLGYIEKVDQFYASYTPDLKEYLNKAYLEISNSASTSLKAARSTPKYREEFDGRGLDYKIGALNTLSAKHEKALLLIPGDADISSHKQKLDEMKLDLETYKSNGEYEKDLEFLKTKKFNAILCPKPYNTDPAMIAIVKRDFNKNKGSLERISIFADTYFVRKNDIGIPLYKSMGVFIVFKSDGKCYLGEGIIKCVYEGGGVYGKPYFQNIDHQEMNCDNVNINK